MHFPSPWTEMFIAYLIAANILAAFVTLFYALTQDGFWVGVVVYIATANIATVALPILMCEDCYRRIIDMVLFRRGKLVRARIED